MLIYSGRTFLRWGGPAALILALTACGTAHQQARTTAVEVNSVHPSSSVGNDVAAVDECEANVDGKTYTSVIDAQTISMDQLRTWYKTRNPGAYSPSQIADVPAEGSVTVCELEAPGIGMKEAPPLPGDYTQGPTGTGSPAVLLLLGLDKDGPVLDTAGPRDVVTNLMIQLH